ncbi:hypothetical protein D5086_006779 [Populus alba]|uniref:Uncharacterized protein n=1 Tax=Populus alba TaxID=43335 RepID=A0ACC4CMC4_POPAL
MILEEQLNESSPQSATTQREMIVPSVHESNTSNGSKNHTDNNNQEDGLFIAKVIHPFDAQAEGELSLSVDDFVVVRQSSACKMILRQGFYEDRSWCLQLAVFSIRNPETLIICRASSQTQDGNSFAYQYLLIVEYP